MTSIKSAMFGKKNNKKFSSGFDVDTSFVTKTLDSLNLEPRRIDFDILTVSPYNTYEFTQEDIEELADSIRNLGLLDFPVVELTEEQHYEILSGQKRYLAIRSIKEASQEEFEKLFPNGQIPCKIIDFQRFKLTNETEETAIPVDTKRMFVIAAGNQQHEKTVRDFMLQVQQMAEVYETLKQRGLISTGLRKREFVSDYVNLQTRSVQKVLNAYRELSPELWDLLKNNHSLSSVRLLEEISKLPEAEKSRLQKELQNNPEYDVEAFMTKKPAGKQKPPVKSSASLFSEMTLNQDDLSRILHTEDSQRLFLHVHDSVYYTEEDIGKLEQIGTKIAKLQKSVEKILTKYEKRQPK